MGTREFAEVFGEGARVLDAAHEQQPLTQLSARARSRASMITTVAPGGHVFSGLRQQGEGLGGALTERIDHGYVAKYCARNVRKNHAHVAKSTPSLPAMR